MLYMTWARLHTPQTQQVITEAYTAIAAELGAAVIPAGLAWQQVLKNDPHPVLHDRDGSHPTPAGSYLAACCTLAVLFGADPAQLPPPADLSNADALLLHRAAASVARR